MPTGKVINPSGPDEAQGELGQVQDVEGNIFPFHNTAHIKKHEPVLFDILQYHLNLHGNLVHIPVAVLELEDGEPAITKTPWSDTFKDRWYKEWDGQNDKKVKDLNIKGKNVQKDIIKGFNKFENGEVSLI